MNANRYWSTREQAWFWVTGKKPADSLARRPTTGVWVGDHWEYPNNVHGMKHKKSDAERAGGTP